MYLAVYLPLIIPVLAALAARPLADQLPPTAATWLLAGSALALAAASSAVLGLLARTALGRVQLLDSLRNFLQSNARVLRFIGTDTSFKLVVR